ncbi:MAG: ankyrin repeat domain-containing protein, partial [Bryobacteraceae bacterium]
DLAKVRLLVERGADVNAVTADGRTALMIAARIRSAEAVVRYLISKGAAVDVADKAGANPVLFAAGAGAAGNLKALVDAGADVEKKRTAPQTVLDRAGEGGLNKAVVDRAIRASQGVTALMGAASSGCEECVRLLLSRKANADARTGTNATPLQLAAYEGNPAPVKLLLDAGATINLADDRGLTPLMLAANSRSLDAATVRLLLDRGADVNGKDEFNRAAADWARIGGSRDIMRLLKAQPAPDRSGVEPGSPPAPAEVAASIRRSLALLDTTAPTFFRKTGCISCHNVSIPSMVLTAARERGFHENQETPRQMVKQTAAFLTPFRENMLSAYCSVPGLATTATYGLMSMHSEAHAPDATTDSVSRCLLVEQNSNGSWRSGDQRPPLSQDGIPPTALVARTLKLYPVPALSREIEASLARARAYLASSRPWSGDDYAFRLLGLSWTGAGKNEIERAARDLAAQQRSDGGWAQTPGHASDAYATGLALSALSMAGGTGPGSSVYQRGVSYLMKTQLADGSWHVRSRAFGFQPYFESGFPHERDQWISMAATAWSVLALMPAARASVASR